MCGHLNLHEGLESVTEPKLLEYTGFVCLNLAAGLYFILFFYRRASVLVSRSWILFDGTGHWLRLLSAPLILKGWHVSKLTVKSSSATGDTF